MTFQKFNKDFTKCFKLWAVQPVEQILAPLNEASMIKVWGCGEPCNYFFADVIECTLNRSTSSMVELPNKLYITPFKGWIDGCRINLIDKQLKK